jgi:hypothetical protein
VRLVQRGLTCAAMLLVIVVLAAPNRLRLGELEPVAFVRLPLEAVVYLAVVLALPPRLNWLRVLLALAGGFVLGLTASFKLLDLGFLEALNRPFDPLIDWTYAGSLVETVRDSVGGGLGTALLVVAALVITALLVLLPLALLRVTRVAARHPRRAWRTLAVVAALWLVLALLDLRVDDRPLASRDTADYVSAQVTRIPGELRDQRHFARAAEEDPYLAVSPENLLAGLRGKDVLIVFVESYGRVAIEDPTYSPGVTAILDSGTRELAAAGFASRAACLTSPTFGAISWLAHATLQTGLWVDSQQRYDALVTSPRLTLSRLFSRAGWRTVADIPANTRDWPQGEFYGYDHIYDSRNVGYHGPRFGYPTMPDQFTLEAFHHLELAQVHRPPVMAEIDLITSHAPWSRTPRLIDQSVVGDGSVFEGMPERLPSERDIWPDPDRVRAAYFGSIEYSLKAVLSFIESYGDDDLVVVLLGDHQPATIVSGEDASHDVPVAVIARDPAVLARIASWGWEEGLRPSPDAPVWRMDLFRDRFLAAYAAGKTVSDD